MKAVILLVVLAAYEYATVETFDLKSLRTKSVFWTHDKVTPTTQYPPGYPIPPNRVEALISLPTRKSKILDSSEYPYQFNTTVQSECETNDSPFVGIRVRNSDYPELTLIFNNDGHIAGMQASVLKTKFTPYAGSDGTRLRTVEWFVEDGDYWTQTVYFTHPSKLCHEGISSPSLFIVKRAFGGGTFETLMVPPKLLEAKRGDWVVGGCVQRMGIHLNKWTDERAKSMCKKFVPFTPLYHPESGDMIGFVMVRYVNLNDPKGDHPWYDFAPTGKGNYKYMFKEGGDAWKCFENDPRWETITTTHTYFYPDPRDIKCDLNLDELEHRWGSWYTEIPLTPLSG